MVSAYEEESLLNDVPPLDPRISDEDLDRYIGRLATDLEVLAKGIRTGPRVMQQLVSLDDLSDALDAAMRLEEARKIPPAEPEA